MHDNLCYLRFLRCLHNQRACNSNIYIFQTDLNIVIFSQLNQTCDSHTLSRICENPGTNIELLSNIWGKRSHSSLISWPFWERKRQGAFCSEVIVFLPPQVSIIFLLAAKAPLPPSHQIHNRLSHLIISLFHLPNSVFSGFLMFCHQSLYFSGFPGLIQVYSPLFHLHFPLNRPLLLVAVLKTLQSVWESAAKLRALQPVCLLSGSNRSVTFARGQILS